MKDRYGNQHQQEQQQQEQQQHACGHRKHCKLQAGCGREYILNPHFQVVFFFCFLVYPLSFFVFCPHCERKAGQDATWTLQRTLWQSGRGNRGVKRGALEGGGERGERAPGACLPICHKNGRHVMMANVEQIGLEGERQRKGERRQTAQLALCQQYQDMSTERNLPLHSALTLVAVSVLCVGITCEDIQFPGWNTEFYLCHTSC